MKFTAAIAPGLLKTLGTTEACGSKLQEVLEADLWGDTCVPRQDQIIRVVLDEDNLVRIELDLLGRDAEVTKDLIYEALIVFFDPEYISDIDVEINNEL
jgi:hypothetical protein